MSDLEKEIEKLISEKKRAKEKELLTKTSFPKNSDSSKKDYLENKPLNNTKQLDIHHIESFKKETLKNLLEAKTAHKKWMSYVQILIALGDIDEAKTEIPINYTMCDFGKWYYGSGQILSEYDKFEEIEAIHQEVHNTYLKIYNLYKEPLKYSLFKNLNKKETIRQEKANKLAITLNQYSKSLFAILNDMSNRLNKMSNEELNIIIS